MRRPRLSVSCLLSEEEIDASLSSRRFLVRLCLLVFLLISILQLRRDNVLGQSNVAVFA